MSLVSRIYEVASTIAASEELTITTSDWTSEVKLIGSTSEEWEVRYTAGDPDLAPGMVAFTDGHDYMVVAPVDYEDEEIKGLEIFDIQPHSVYEFEPAVTVVPPGLLRVKSRLNRLVAMGMLPEETLEAFSGKLVKAAILDRILLFSCQIRFRKYPVYKIREDLVPEGYPLIPLRKGGGIHVAKREIWRQVAITTMPLRLEDVIIGDTPDLQGSKAEPPAGGFYEQSGRMMWVWAVSWPGEAVLHLKDCGFPGKFSVPKDAVLLVVQPSPEDGCLE